MNNGIAIAQRTPPPAEEEKERQSLAAQLAQALRQQGRTSDALSVQFDDIAMRALYAATNLARIMAELPPGPDVEKLLSLYAVNQTVLQVQGMAGELKSLHAEQMALFHRNPPL